ncbi:MAG TPA: hypothetical protein VGL23_12575 [Chloroflexota bacterium]
MLRRLPLPALLIAALLLPSISQAAGPLDDRFGLIWINPPGKVASEIRLGQATALGAKWDRFPLYWNEIQPTPNGPLDFSKVDPIVNADVARGIKVQGILLGAPDWATGGGKLNLDAWSRFVREAVSRYRGRIVHWEMWNEPDMLDGDGKGRYWVWGVESYADLLKAGYRAAKAADGGTTVLMAGLAMPYNNEGFFGQLLDALARDPSAPSSGWFFDVLPIHVYDRAARVYELPLGYLGFPSFAGYHTLMKRRGFDRPVWINELGVPVWDYATGQKAPGRATQDEQAAFILQSLAYGLAAGNERIFFSQLYDDGAGAIDARSGQPAEFFGLISNDGNARPAYSAYRAAIDMFAGAQLATRLNSGRTIKNRNSKGVEMISLWGTGRGRVTVAWNAEGGAAATAAVPAVAPTAQLLDKFGRLTGSVSAQGGVFRVTLPPATNNNNFDCFTPRGCDSDDYVMGGNPVVLVEASSTVPAVMVDPLPSAGTIPFQVSWRPTRPLPGGALYDVQYKDLTATPGDGGWQDWLTGTDRTAAAFGGETEVALDHSYAFRVRVRDAAGHPLEGDWPAAPLASTLVVGGDTWPPRPAEVDAKIEIVWPHGGASVREASQANVTAAVFRHGGLTSVGPSFAAPVRLWSAVDNGVEQPVALGTPRAARAGSLNYPLWDFNDVDVSAARDPKKKVYLRLSIDGKREATNVWSHASDARTYMPQPDVPSGLLPSGPTSVDAKIEIVWPHDNAPVEQAQKVNVVAYLFEHGGTRSVPAGFDGQVVLHRSLNNGPAEAVALGDKETRTVNGLTFPVWTFNDVDVAAARDKSNKYYFRLEVGGVTGYSNVWAHAADARTYVPQPDVPTAVAP